MKRDRARIEKLKEAYVKARYSKHYRITKEELEWLGIQVEELGRVVHAVCSERIEQLRADRSEEHTSELQSLMRISYAVFCLTKKTHKTSLHYSLLPDPRI